MRCRFASNRVSSATLAITQLFSAGIPKIGSRYLSSLPESIILMQIKIFAMRDIIDFKESFPRKMEFSGAKLSEDNGP